MRLRVSVSADTFLRDAFESERVGPSYEEVKHIAHFRNWERDVLLDVEAGEEILKHF